MSATGPQKATRKERREEARQARRALEAQESQRQLRRLRLIQLGAAGVVAIIVIAIALAVSSSGGGGSNHVTAKGSAQADKVRAEVVSLLAGIPQSGDVLGSPKAPVTMKYFGDLECPICREFTVGALPSLIANFVRKGQLKIEYRSMETATRNPTVFQEQQTAALAAGKQNLMWYYVELFYHQQGPEGSGYVTPTFLRERAEQVPGLNLVQWEAERHDPSLATQVEADETVAGEQGFEGTPSFLVSNGHVTRKLTSFTEQQLTDAAALFEPTIEKLLKG
jgi:protein-disulfide isomerase